MKAVLSDYHAACSLEPHHPSLNHGIWSAELGKARFAGGELFTSDTSSDDHRGGRGRYYRRRLTPEEFDQDADLRVEATFRVLQSTGSPAATCVAVTTLEGRTFGVGFLKELVSPKPDQVVFFADNGEPLEGHGDYLWPDWLLNPVVLGTYEMPLDVTRTYVLELLRRGREANPLVRLSIQDADLETPLMETPLVDLRTRPALPGVLFGHPVIHGYGGAVWQRLTISKTTDSIRVADTVRHIGQRRQLFLDDWIVEESAGLERRLGRPVKHPGNPVLKREHPWEAVQCDLYGSALWDPNMKKLRLYYETRGNPGGGDDKLAYAESIDGGCTWVKPELDLFPFEDHERTNLVWLPMGRALAGPSVFYDEDETAPARRYKLFTGDYDHDADHAEAKGIHVAFSADGIHWKASKLNPVTRFVSDTGHCAFWDPQINRYVAYVRAKLENWRRCVARIESEDFEHWTQPEICFHPPVYQYYSMGVTPYEGIYIGTPWIVWEKSKDRTAHTPVISPGLAVSRDGWDWQQLFLGQALLPTGEPHSGDNRQIRMASSLVVMEDRILLFYGQSDDPYVKDMGVDIGMATLRLDGFVSMAGGKEPGRLLTRPFVLEGQDLFVNAACEPGGQISIAMLDEDGKVLPGLGHAECAPIDGDGIKQRVVWQEQATLSPFCHLVVRLEFRIDQAEIYSFWCQDSSDSPQSSG